MGKFIQGAILVLVFASIGVYGVIELRGPDGLPALKERWTEIRKLEEQNANLQRENDYRRERIKRLEGSASEQELEIRKQLKLLRPGETTFILPEQPKQPADQQSDPAPASK
ncbi:MAG TPA: septum formation initiator family protein [Bryobacteraceae bacterium]|nr:septum formation initiator family protein [Bryobacteraceae bacterium]